MITNTSNVYMVKVNRGDEIMYIGPVGFSTASALVVRINALASKLDYPRIAFVCDLHEQHSDERIALWLKGELAL